MSCLQSTKSVRARAALTVVAQVFLWAYILKGLFTVVFERLGGVGELGAACSLLPVSIITAAVCAMRDSRIAPLLERRAVGPVAGMVGAVSCAAAIVLACYGGSAALESALTLVLLGIQAASFCVVFLAWTSALHTQVYTDGLSAVLLRVMASIVICLLMVPNWLNGTTYQCLLDIAGTAVAGVCLYLVLLPPKEGQEEGRPEPAVGGYGEHRFTRAGRDLVPWLALVAAFLFMGGFLGHASYLMPDYLSTNEDLVTYLLMFIVLFGMIILIQRVERDPDHRAISALVLTFGLVAIGFAILFSMIFIISTDSSFCYDLARFTRRMTRIAAFIALMVVVYQFGLSPVRVYGLCFLIPVMAPKLVQMILARALPGAMGAAGPANEAFMAALLVSGFAMTLMLIGFCFASINGNFARALLGVGDADAGEQASTDDRPAQAAVDAQDRRRGRQEACDSIGRERDLTRREAEILYYVSLGYSAKRISQELYISEGTVNTHSAALYRKLDVHTRQEVIDLVDAAGVR